MTYLLAGLVLGLAGSLHCAGMCGPILLAVNRSASGRDALTRMLIYHASRISIYCALGVVAGYTGRAASTAGLGRAIAIVAGALLVLGSIGVLAGRWTRPLTVASSSLAIRAGTAAAALTRQRPLAGHALLGAANGLLPCGLVYAALAASLALGTVVGSVVFMSGFGLGTMPVLIALTISAASIPFSWRRRFRLAVPVLMVAAGSLLIAWGVMPSDSAAHHRHEAALLTHQH
jgi:uncharacterized protein